MKFQSDIDIDFGDRKQILDRIDHVPASIVRNGELIKHNSGIYVTAVPVDPITGQCGLDYQAADERGYVKLDFLNVSLYNQIKNEDHLLSLMNTEPAWDKLYEREFFEKLIHVGAHYDTLIRMPEAVNTIPRLAMFLAVIRPAKRHLIGKTWQEVAKTVWERPNDGSYYFKKSHSVSYAHLVVINMNLLSQASAQE